jgi:hypothetical protein
MTILKYSGSGVAAVKIEGARDRDQIAHSHRPSVDRFQENLAPIITKFRRLSEASSVPFEVGKTLELPFLSKSTAQR